MKSILTLVTVIITSINNGKFSFLNKYKVYKERVRFKYDRNDQTNRQQQLIKAQLFNYLFISHHLLKCILFH